MCVNAGGPHRSESAGLASTERQMRTDYSAVKKHMKGNTGNGSDRFPPPLVTISTFENNSMDAVTCPRCDLRGCQIEHTCRKSR